MKVLAVIGSPRKGGNTQALVEEAVRGAESAGATCETVTIASLAINPCRACEGCKKTNKCVQNDDMQSLYPRILESDALIIGSPVYWWGPSAQMKAFLDRWYALVRNNVGKRFRGKRAVILTPFADDDPSTADHLIGTFRRSFEYLGINLVGVLPVTASDAGEVRENPEAMEAAFRLGQKVAGTPSASKSH